MRGNMVLPVLKVVHVALVVALRLVYPLIHLVLVPPAAVVLDVTPGVGHAGRLAAVPAEALQVCEKCGRLC